MQSFIEKMEFIEMESFCCGKYVISKILWMLRNSSILFNICL